jgi:pimeloyl-ACP methyl ester carboxylesterase
MMPATKESWDELAELLNKEQFHVLAIDLRGHGESVFIKGENSDAEKINYQDFTNEQHQNKILDVEGALNWLSTRGVELANILVGGASIGANLTIQILAENHQLHYGFALSPGLDYRGIKSNELFYSLNKQQQVFLTAAQDDPKSADSVEILEQIAQHNHKPQLTVETFEKGGHGTNLFGTQPEFINLLVNWIKQQNL